MDSIEISAELIKYPKPGTDRIASLDVSHITPILDKIGQVASVTKATAPQLMADFNYGYSETNKIITFLRYELDRSKNLLKLRESEVLLDISGDVIKKKGQSPNKELREAVVMMDTVYQKLLEDKSQLDALVKYLEGQLKSLEMAYQSVKKVAYSDDKMPMSYDYQKR